MNAGLPTKDTVPVQHGKVAIIPYVNTMHSTHKGILKPNGISDDVRTTHVLTGLKSGALVSLGKIYDDRCDMVINRRHLKIYKNLNAS